MAYLWGVNSRVKLSCIETSLFGITHSYFDTIDSGVTGLKTQQLDSTMVENGGSGSGQTSTMVENDGSGSAKTSTRTLVDFEGFQPVVN